MRFPRERPGFDAAHTKIAGELGAVAVNRIDPPRLHFVNEGVQIVIARVVRERKDFVTLVAVFRCRVHPPSAHHREAGARSEQADGTTAACRRRHHEDMPEGGPLLRIKNLTRWQCVSERGDGFIHFRDRGVNLKGKLRRAGVERKEDLLRFAKGIGEEDGDLPVLDRFAGEARHIGEDTLRGGEAEFRQPEGCFHDEGIGGPGLIPLCARGRSGFEITGVQKRRTILQAGQVQHRRARNVPGGKEFHLVAFSDATTLSEIEIEEVPLCLSESGLDQ